MPDHAATDSFPPPSLSDDQLTAIMRAAQPLQVSDRDPFVRIVMQALSASTELGDGSVHRVLAATQKLFLQSNPFGEVRGGGPKYGRAAWTRKPGKRRAVT